MGNRRGPTLAQRSAATRAAEAGAQGTVDAGAELDARRRRHCWVIGPPEDPGPWPGLILEWHRGDGGWRARVVYLTEVGGAETAVQTWLEASLLRPA